MIQELLFIRDWKRQGMVNAADPVALAQKPSRVWTLIGYYSEHEKPDYPFRPVHRRNAFLEDESHDWSWHNGVFKYRSRVADGPVWILLEYS